MDERDSQTVLVLLKPASGRTVTIANTTAATVTEAAPSPHEAARVARYFADRGCEVGPLVGVSFSLTVPADAVASVLGEEVDGAFPKPPIPRSVARTIDGIVRDRPIDFGPVSFS